MIVDQIVMNREIAVEKDSRICRPSQAGIRIARDEATIDVVKSTRYPSHGSYRGKMHERERSSSNRRDDYPDEHRRRPSAPSRGSTAPSREVSAGLSGGREEGEISPRMSNLAIDSPAPPKDSKPPTPPPQSTSSQDVNIPDQEAEEDEMTAEQVIAAQRARRQALLARLGSSASTPGEAAVNPDSRPTPIEGGQSSANTLPTAHASFSDHTTQTGVRLVLATQDTGIATPEDATTSQDGFALTKETQSEDPTSDVPRSSGPSNDGEQVSAADYDPNQDRKEEEMRLAVHVAKAESGMDIDEVEEVEESEDDDEVDDMFAAIARKPEKKKVRRVKRVPSAVPVRAATTVDSAADPEGYYQIILGEALDAGRYQVFSSLGKGMFSAVVRARIVQGEKDEIGKEVAIKIIRSQESMYKAGLKEAAILNKLAAADPEDKKHLVRLHQTFEHRGHLCLVFESLSMNLREIVKRFGKDVGLNMRAVRAYAHQLFLALSLLKKCNIMHADIKPDNILVNDTKAMLKLCDLGSASDVSENDITPYLVSRFYRAPEIILGLPYDTALDMWSVGCTLYELYTGKILFPGRTNNHMLLLMMELKGRFNAKMIKKAKFGDVHFDEHGGFLSVEVDKITGKEVTRTVFVQKATRDLRARLVPTSAAKGNDEESKSLLAFVDLLDKCLALDPAKRITPRDALIHPFIRG
ncbi:U4/U6 small nuclear ribonucleoprotein prp4 [Tulasnella sp. 403]|nr:U4/U6 small nuclear ribonucleoprotein prp4 [Tulasnella sp. 403]